MSTSTSRPLRPLAFLLAWGLLTSCAAPGNFVWVDDLPKRVQTSDPSYVIVPGDVISVRVFNQEHMSAKGRVRADGKFSVPFLSDLQAAGFTPSVLAAQIQTRLRDFINNPVVTVSLEEVQKVEVSVLGEVSKPGLYVLSPGAGVLQALAAAGGLNDYAKRDLIFVLRPSAQSAEVPTRIRFTYASLSRALGSSGTFSLQPGDSVVVE